MRRPHIRRKAAKAPGTQAYDARRASAAAQNLATVALVADPAQVDVAVMDDLDDALPAVVTRMKAAIRDLDVLTCRLELPFPELERKGFSICLKGMGSSALGRYMAPGFLSSLGNAQHQLIVPSFRRGVRRRSDDLRARHREKADRSKIVSDDSYHQMRVHWRRLI